MKKALITGITGQDGSYLTEFLLDRGYEIFGIENKMDAQVFHAGIKRENGALVTTGGRVLAVTALAPTLEIVREKALAAVEHIKYENKYYRKDIGLDLTLWQM